MKKQSRVIRQNYEKYGADQLAFYGILMKSGRVRLDSKRFRKFFPLPDERIERRSSVYYTPTRVKASDYVCNVFRGAVSEIKHLWINEFSKAIQLIKTPQQVEDDARIGLICNGIFEFDEAEMGARFEGAMRVPEYRFVIKSLYAQFFHQMMADLDALCLRVVVNQGFSGDRFSRQIFDTYIQGKQNSKGAPAKKFEDYEHYHVYDEAYCVWNFLKHNAISAYQVLKERYPDRIYDPNDDYRSGQSSLSVIKLDEKYILYVLDHICDFFDEVCQHGFGEDPKTAEWDYDDYFLKIANDSIESIENPLGIPPWL
ncbi:MAG: hypothetical protein PUJ43_02160 [Bacillales bacterium]|nr:hypothetical protein [Bacillales bacterium]MDY5920722.1 hypothetical protein [Candidatus Enteromonas sp.]